MKINSDVNYSYLKPNQKYTAHKVYIRDSRFKTNNSVVIECYEYYEFTNVDYYIENKFASDFLIDFKICENLDSYTASILHNGNGFITPALRTNTGFWFGRDNVIIVHDHLHDLMKLKDRIKGGL